MTKQVNIFARSSVGASNLAETEREMHDYYATPNDGTDALFKHESFGKIWECASGGNHIADRVKNYKYEDGTLVYPEVFSSDLIKRRPEVTQLDFLSDEASVYKGEYDIITNPPYKLALEFCERAIDLSKNKTAMFLRLLFLEGIGRYSFFKQYPPETVYIFPWRVQTLRGGIEDASVGKSFFAFAWFVWNKSANNKDTKLEWFDPKIRSEPPIFHRKESG